MTLLDKVREMPPHWANETIRPFDEDLCRDSLPFARRHYWCDSGSVNVFRIVGTTHPTYQNKTWDWMIRNAKKISSNLMEYEKNPGYYLQTAKKGDLSYITMDGLDFYIGQGNHRSTIARFDFHYRGITTLHGVSIEDIRVDWPLYECFQRINQLVKGGITSCSVSSKPEVLSEERFSGGSLDTLLPQICIREKGEELILKNTEEAEMWILERKEALDRKRKPSLFERLRFRRATE